MNRGTSPETLARALAAAGANLTLRLPSAAPISIGADPTRAVVTFRNAGVFRRVLRGDVDAATEAYVAGDVDVVGELGEALKATDLFDLGGGRFLQAAFDLALRLPGRRGRARRTAMHYEQSPDFFLPWLERWRSYSHGLYVSPDDPPAEAQARKMQRAIDALGLEPGMHVFDMGCGWGAFLEYAGRRSIRVHGITISSAQHAFVERLIREHALPCTVERVDFLNYRPQRWFDGAVFMGTLEHMPHYRRVSAFLACHLTPEGRVWADFLAHRRSRAYGTFMRRLWPGLSTYVSLQGVVTALVHAGFNIHEVEDDTQSYALTVRDWARALEARRDELATRFGERAVRTFLLFLWGSHHFFTTNRTQAYHLVAGRRPATLRQSATSTASPHVIAKASPTRP